MDEDLEMKPQDTETSRLKRRLQLQEATIVALREEVKALTVKVPTKNALKPVPETDSPPSPPPSNLMRLPETGVQNPLSMMRSESSVPLSGGDLEVFLYFFLEVLRPRPEITTVDPCIKMSGEISRADCTAMAKVRYSKQRADDAW